MKADITAEGKLVLTPETGTEAYALIRWSENAVVQQPDVSRHEIFHYRGSSMTIDLSRFPGTVVHARAPLTRAERETISRAWSKP